METILTIIFFTWLAIAAAFTVSILIEQKTGKVVPVLNSGFTFDILKYTLYLIVILSLILGLKYI